LFVKIHQGSAGTFGATHMSEIAARIDKAARAGEADQATASFDEFRSECERVRRYLATELERKLGPDGRPTE
jgi:HPt (histidine-containing phosphotransfer) domain-containing protein